MQTFIVYNIKCRLSKQRFVSMHFDRGKLKDNSRNWTRNQPSYPFDEVLDQSADPRTPRYTGEVRRRIPNARTQGACARS